MVELFFGNNKTLAAIKESQRNENELFVTTQINPEKANVISKDLYKTGVIGRIIEVENFGDKIRVLFEAQKRAKIADFARENPYFEVEYDEIEDENETDDEIAALKNNLVANLKTLINTGKTMPLDIVVKLFSISDPNKLVNNLVPLIDDEIGLKQEILETIDLKGRMEKANHLLAKALKMTELEQKVAEKTQEELSKTQKEVYLREEMKAIQKELGGEEGNEYTELKRKIEAAGMPPNVLDIALKELSHLEKSPSFSPEVSFIRNYLDWLIAMPWNKYAESYIDIKEAEKILNEDHYGLEKVKKRILEFLAVQSLTGKVKSQILCFVGPPGTGKTSIGKSIAKALGRKFIRMSLGGIRDEAEIRGHRRTYVGAMPGRIIQGIRQSEVKNPVFMLDEIDKLGADFRGDPSSALLEALDPEQNSNFSDHYLEVPFDLSDVMFITTANVIENIPPPLRDRMEVIEFPGYTEEEKFFIAKKYIWPKIVAANGLQDKGIKIEDSVINTVIDIYTQEAGVRNLERELSKIARKMALIVIEKAKYDTVIKPDMLQTFLGQPKVERWMKESGDRVGVVAALAVTEAGGEILSVEASSIPGGHGNLIITGHLGEVMKESAQAALSYARTVLANYGVDPKSINTTDIHVHVPLGAVPKDGPSAGAAIALAIISALTNRQINAEMGMTGEITLRGRILRIGGVKEKILAAKRAGLKFVILPKSNEGDLSEVQTEYKNGTHFFLANTMDEILPIALR